jgi:hypothetical protein
MSIFRRPDYTSEATAFLDGLKASKPTLEAEQLAGRAIWWDKAQTLSEQANNKAARVPQKPYVYSTSSHPNAAY